ncbi:hypothetical protein NE237_002148 [Protea cynaroides]|uniref:Uncharacterized protein n=1 Tax=Protea cynaroides TaxID=273540 RepID=A0A9Q0KUQ2_9MAGN|nr:hypothetical protein NE237_002148 [Protea cynaroides]
MEQQTRDCNDIVKVIKVITIDKGKVMPLERELAEQKGRVDEASELASREKKRAENVSTMLNRATDNLALVEEKASNAESETARVRESIPLKITKALEEYKDADYRFANCMASRLENVKYEVDEEDLEVVDPPESAQEDSGEMPCLPQIIKALHTELVSWDVRSDGAAADDFNELKFEPPGNLTS